MTVVAYGKYEFVDPSVRPDWDESSRRFLEAGLKSPGCISFTFGEDIYDPSVVYMVHIWETKEHFQAFTSSKEHDVRIEETKAFEAANQVRRTDLIFFDGEITRRAQSAS
jgi:quinol monooxygenase YgiN